MPKCNFDKVAKIALRHGCPPVNLLWIFRTPFPKNTFEGMFLPFQTAYVHTSVACFTG